MIDQFVTAKLRHPRRKIKCGTWAANVDHRVSEIKFTLLANEL
jgi:hypothetical protein